MAAAILRTDAAPRSSGGRTVTDDEPRRQPASDPELIAAVVNSMMEGLVVIDAGGVFTLVNPTAARLLGYTALELTGLHRDHVIPADQRWIVAEADRRANAGEAGLFELDLVRRDASRFAARLSGSPLFVDERFAGIVVLFTDLSEEKRIKGDRLRLREALRHSQKMDALGQLAGGMAHDFNNILQVINGHAELAQLELAGGQEPADSLTAIREAASRATTLVARVLAFSRGSDEAIQPVAVPPLIQESLQLLRATLPATVEIREDIDPSCPPILGHPDHLHQILTHLATNAWQAMGDQGGLLEVELHPYRVGDAVASLHADLKAGDYLRLTIRDSGCGMDEGTLEHIFEPYFTTRDCREGTDSAGTGLGLAIVHGMVRQVGGAITVSSKPENGTTFQVFLPVTAADAQEKPVVQPGEIELPRGTERILFVDDETQIVTLGCRQLESLGYTVTGAADGQEALQVLRADPGAFDLLITDQTMPRLTGDELAAAVQRLRPDLPVILCTGYGDSYEDERATELGIDTVLAKPVSRRRLATTVRATLDRAADKQ